MVFDIVYVGGWDPTVRAALNGLAIRSPFHEPNANPATKVSVVVAGLVELEAMVEPDALRESIVARASIRVEANLSLLLATTNLPRPLREACQRSSMRLGPSPPVVGSTFQGDGGGLFGSSVPCRPMDTPKVTMCCQLAGSAALVRTLSSMSSRRSVLQYL